MAGDWIKMELDLIQKLEVIQLSTILGVNRYEVIGRLHVFWSWVNKNSTDGQISNIPDTFFDELVSLDGFSAALRKVDWLQVRSGSLVVPHFDRHNGYSAKHRAVTNERKRKQRKASREDRDKCHDDTVTHLGHIREEKRREENKKDITKVISKKNHSPPAQSQRRAKPDSVAEVIAYVQTLGLPDSDGEYLYEHWQSNGYTRNNKPIKDWKAACRSWNAAGYFPSQKHRKETQHEPTDYSEGFAFKR